VAEVFETRLLETIEDVVRTPIAPATARRARHVLLDTLGCALAGLRAEPLVALTARVGVHDAGSARVPGLPPLTVAGAAGLLAIGACWDEACEGHAEAHGRPGLHAAPVVLALAAMRPLDIAEVVKALVVGYEVGARAGAVLRIRPGMHVDGAWGLFATAAAAACVFGLSPAGILGAIRSAACQVPFSLYLPIATGSFARNTYLAHAQATGLQLAHAAAAGIVGPAGATDAYAEKALGIAALTHAAAPTVRMIETGYLKAYAGVKHAHYPVAAVLAALRERALQPADIDAIRIRIYREAIVYCSNRAPSTPIQAQFSMSYAVAAAIVLGDLGPRAYARDVLEDPTVRRLEACVRIEEDAARTAANTRGAEVIFFRGGARIAAASVDSVLGDAARPFDDDDVRGKFATYAGPTLGADAIGIADHFLKAALDRPLFPPQVQTAV
jgi:2-methylcitrate dehydratase PrpD